jgi:hypothetical protein
MSVEPGGNNAPEPSRLVRTPLVLGFEDRARRGIVPMIAFGTTVLSWALAAPTCAFGADTTTNTHEAAESGRYAFLLAFCALVVPSVVAWYVSRSRAKKRGTGTLAVGFRRLLVGDDNRVSTSKTAAVVWTYLIAMGLLSLVVTKWLGHPGAFNKATHSGLGGQYALLLGGPLGAAILAKGIVGSQVNADATVKPANQNGPRPSELIANDVGNTDLGDFQYVLFNAVAIAYFVGTLLQSPQDGLPHMPDVLLGLTSVSAAGYVSKKALPAVKPVR